MCLQLVDQDGLDLLVVEEHAVNIDRIAGLDLLLVGKVVYDLQELIQVLALVAPKGYQDVAATLFKHLQLCIIFDVHQTANLGEHVADLVPGLIDDHSSGLVVLFAELLLELSEVEVEPLQALLLAHAE